MVQFLINSQVNKEVFYFRGSHLTQRLHVMVGNKVLDPVNVAVLSFIGVVSRTQNISNLLKQLGLKHD